MRFYFSSIQAKWKIHEYFFRFTCYIFSRHFSTPYILQINTTQINLINLLTVPVSTLILSPTKLSVNSGKIVYLECQTNYCNPPSTIIWYINNEKIAGHVNITIDTSSTGLSRTTSVLQYTAVTSDDGNLIFCTASNIEGLTIRSTTNILDVRCECVRCSFYVSTFM